MMRSYDCWLFRIVGLVEVRFLLWLLSACQPLQLLVVSISALWQEASEVWDLYAADSLGLRDERSEEPRLKMSGF